jgi:hypothetical protein
MRKTFALLAVALVLTGCGGAKLAEPVLPIYSPNGEPLNGGPLGFPKCDEALSQWFDRMDTSHHGIDRAQFLADARAQFDRMDLDHDGTITPSELTTFRMAYPQPEPPRPRMSGGPPQDGERSRDRPQPRTAPHSMEPADPVMSADTGLHFRVTRAEFMAQAGEIFAKLDTKHDGLLTRSAVQSGCTRPSR